MPAGVVLRNWRAGLLGGLLLGFALLIILALANQRPSADELPLRGVPESAYTSAGVELYPAYEDILAREGVAFGPKGAEFLAGGLICCGRPFQTVLVALQQVGGDSSILSYALNYDTSKAPEYPILGGHFATVVNREFDYFVAFLDATTGKLIYRLQPGYVDPFPSADEPTGYAAAPIVARNLDGPNVFVTLWTGGPETTVVECGEEELVASTKHSAARGTSR